MLDAREDLWGTPSIEVKGLERMFFSLMRWNLFLNNNWISRMIRNLGTAGGVTYIGSCCTKLY